eukprot:scaffold63003_cov46-Phaeocystis_antarctica.AAC.1
MMIRPCLSVSTGIPVDLWPVPIFDDPLSTLLLHPICSSLLPASRSIGEPPRPPPLPPLCADSDPEFCRENLPTSLSKSLNCKTARFYEKCWGSCGFCALPPAPPPPPPPRPPPLPPLCADSDPEFCRENLPTFLSKSLKTARFYEKCWGSCGFCALPPAPPPPPSRPPPLPPP